MKSHNISIHDKGFTLIEIVVVIGIIGLIAVIGIIAGIDTYQRYIFRSDLDKTVALLQKARSSAINNIDEEEYGVVLDDPDSLILFRGTVGTTYDYEVEKSKTATFSDTCPSHKVVFERLTGNTTACQIVITEGNKLATTTINSQGGINY